MKILLVDDEPLARQRLVRLLARLRPEAQVLEAENGVNALAIARAEQPEILLLDIRMPGMDGVAVAAALAEESAPPAVIFCTAYDEYALEALQQHAVAYLLKPVRERELDQSLQAAVRVNRAQLAALGVSPAGRLEIVSASHRGVETRPVSELRCLIAEDKYVRACTPQGDILINDSLKELEQEFSGRFLRVHRNALVALRHVVRLGRGDAGWWVELEGLTIRPQVSRRHVSALKEALARRASGLPEAQITADG